MKNDIINGIDVDRVGGGFYYNLIIKLSEKYAKVYPNAFNVCGYYNLKEITDIQTYIERAMEYVAEEYELDLDYKIEFNDREFKIYLTDTNETLINGYFKMMEETTIYHFNENIE